ncbi:MAG: hypothetical protein WKF86_08985 [Acidimicrobiales bacterium]
MGPRNRGDAPSVLAHFEEEERIAFPMLRAIMPAEELAALGAGSFRPAGLDAEVIDLAAAEGEAAEGAPAEEEEEKAGPARGVRRLLRRR